jgi:pantoate--beta-alanine ligase
MNICPYCAPDRAQIRAWRAFRQAAALLIGRMLIARSRNQIIETLAGRPAVALVPTMGALHEGHLALVAAASAAGPVVASIFVNPLQFGAGEDLARYPRDEAGDLAALAAAGCAVAFLPTVADIYADDDATTVEVAGPAIGWEGARRPGHFRGVATVVTRLFNLVRPASAWFGEKDWQQLQVIRRMTIDLSLNVAIHAVPTLRAADGLALSSRNRFLTPAERAIAPALSRSGVTTAEALRAGADPGQTLAETRAALTSYGFDVEYFAAVAPDSLVELSRIDGPARLIAAARLGSVRLLDNFAV